MRSRLLAPLLAAACCLFAAVLLLALPGRVAAQAGTGASRTPTPFIYAPPCSAGYGSGYVSGCGPPPPTLTPPRTPTATPLRTATPPASATPVRTATPPGFLLTATPAGSRAGAASPSPTRPTAGSPTTTPATDASATRTLPAATLSPTRSPTPLPPFVVVGQPLAGWTIALDAGHGGRDPGALYHGLRESEVNLAIVLLARPLLESAGARVVLTRDRDVLVGPADGTITQDLQARAQAANRAGAHLFVSVHANVHGDGDVHGAITFYGVESGYAGGQRRSERQVELSRRLADAVQQGVVQRTGELDRGVRPATFWVLGATTMPSILLESGFLTNEQEARNLADPAFRRRIAEGIAAGLVDYVVSGQVLPTDRAPAIAGHPGVRHYEVTGHNLAHGFRHFFDTRGGLDLFGYPRTEEIVENGWTVQYFQRARFEYHPEHAGTPYEVQLGLLGDALTTPRRPFPPGTPFVSGENHRWYPETGHSLHFGFLRYFDARGGLDVFGYPISEELVEGGFTVQYFQRARFEYHPEHAGTPYEVQLGLLGDQLLQQRGWLR